MFSKPNYNYNNYPWSGSIGNQQQQATNNIIWVQGEAGAKSYPVAPGQSVQLMDSEDMVFYIKSADVSGMPMPLRIFHYTEKTAVAKNETTTPIPSAKVDYVTRDEFDKAIAELKNAQSIIPTA